MSDYGEHPPRERRSRWSSEDTPRSDRRNTEHLSPVDTDWSDQEPVNPGWRSSRTTRRTTRRTPRTLTPNLPGSLEEVPTWLQQGGWRYVAAAATLLIVLLLVLLWSGREGPAPETIAQNTPAGEGGLVMEESEPLGQQDLPPSPAPPTAVEPSPAATFVVAGTNGQGLFLRSDHTVDSVVLETLPDGTVVEQIGEDFVGPNYVWRNVRAPSGQEGWVAVDWLQPAP